MRLSNMQTVIFLNQRGYQNFNFDRIVDENKFRFIAILQPESEKNFPQTIKKYFSKLYVLPEQEKRHFFENLTLPYNHIKTIVHDEIQLAGSSKKLTIFCMDEFNLLNAAKLRDEFQIPGPSENDILPYRNKIIMKERLLKCNLRVPKFCTLDKKNLTAKDNNYYQLLVNKLGETFVIKPTSGASSVDTTIIHDVDEFNTVTQKITNSPFEFEAEEFIDGTLYHFDAIINNKKVMTSFVSEYSVPNIEFLHGHCLATIPLRDDDPLVKKIKHFSQQILACLGLIDGSLHLELFHSTTGKLIFLEVGARVPGSGIALNYAQMYEVDMYNISLQQTLSMPVNYQKKKPIIYSFVLLIPYKKGKITRIRQPELNSKVDITWNIKVDDIIETTSANVFELAARAIISNSNYTQLYEDFLKLKQYKAYDVV